MIIIERNYASILMQQLGVKNWGASQAVYPKVNAMNWTIARLEWGLPHPDDRVEYEIWTSANDEASVKFKQNWRNTALTFDYNNYTLFTPHVYILNGTHWGCDDGHYDCGNQCTNAGRKFEKYLCMEVNLLNNDKFICVNIYVNSSTKLNESLWWDYSNLWNKNCWLTENVEQTFTETCSFTQMDSLDSNMTAWVRQCIESSGGYNYTGGVNTILEEETSFREESHIYTLPTVLVNAAIVRGNIDCNQITEQTCQVLDAICAGFVEGSAPSQCSQVPAVNCSDSDKDCAGICNGQSLTDRCGVCLPSQTDSRWDSCVGCDGVPYSGKKFNDCGYCLSNTTEGWQDEGKDCRGICGGDYVVDSCGNCLSSNDENFNSCKYSSGGGDSNSKASTSLTLVIVLSVVSFLVIVLCGFIVYRLWTKQQAVDQRFTNIMKQYQLMDQNGGIETKAHAVADDEPDD
ncbi:hypothetical protein RFI_27431 [Reticulomyxa filosa]|uniref:Vacuolar sorting receptor thioredoxin-like domain-containing protein n=1 Tax=Reticulomyxa filosa TaxID=46433 RepID=X6M7J1_RETFI|nr:hypothetical protein RFI_27431 [Reticulomyxa filosa]|eukprot:ETO09948.1 hypothetical protein RFI_27431 [Reticulomyxa filosa]